MARTLKSSLMFICFVAVCFHSCESGDKPHALFVVADGAKTLALEGEWKFKPGDELQWASPDFSDEDWKTHPVPGAWIHHGYEGKGIAWYRAWIEVPEHMAGSQNWALALGVIMSAAEIYWDGNLLVRYGKVGDSRATEKVGLSDYLYLIPDAHQTAGRHLLAIRVSNFHAYSGNILDTPRFGSYRQLFARHNLRMAGMSILIGLFLLSCVYHLTLFCFNWSRLEFLYLALLAFAAAAFVVLVEMQGLHVLPSIFDVRVGHSLLMGISVLLYLFLARQFEFTNRWLRNFVVVTSGVLLLPLFMPLELEFFMAVRLRWFQITQLIGVFVILWALRQRKPGSLMVALGVVPLALGTIYAFRKLDDTWGHAGFAVFTVFMAMGLANKMRAAENEVRSTRDVFRRFVPDPILNKIARHGLPSIKLGGAEENFATILFADISGFATIAEGLTPNDTLAFLNAFMQSMQPVISQHGGFINQFVGDEVMTIFHENGHAEAAIKCAITMQQSLAAHNAARIARGEPAIEIGVGINSGKVIWGTIGSASRMESAIIGDTVNLASRLQSLTRRYQVGILAAESVYRNLLQRERFSHREVDTVQVKGKTQSVVIYEFFDADTEPLKTQKLESLQNFREGLEHYHAGRWQCALLSFEACLKACPDDAVAALYRARCEEFNKNPSGVASAGVTVLHEK